MLPNVVQKKSARNKYEIIPTTQVCIVLNVYHTNTSWKRTTVPYRFRFWQQTKTNENKQTNKEGLHVVSPTFCLKGFYHTKLGFASIERARSERTVDEVTLPLEKERYSQSVVDAINRMVIVLSHAMFRKLGRIIITSSSFTDIKGVVREQAFLHGTLRAVGS